MNVKALCKEELLRRELVIKSVLLRDGIGREQPLYKYVNSI